MDSQFSQSEAETSVSVTSLFQLYNIASISPCCRSTVHVQAAEARGQRPEDDVRLYKRLPAGAGQGSGSRGGGGCQECYHLCTGESKNAITYVQVSPRTLTLMYR